MGLQDLIVTPIYLFLLTFLAYFIRPFVTTPETRKYFLPALWVRFFGAIMLGVVYQFYYGGGDTFNYFTHGSKWIWEAFLHDPGTGLKLLFSSGGSHTPETFEYSQNIWYYRDQSSYFVVRMVAFIDLFTFHSYSGTALFFALFSFSGAWAFYMTVVNRYPHSLKYLAISILFVPSVIFWGSGILKDTITLGALGWMTCALINIIEFKNRNTLFWLVIFVAGWIIFLIKVYIIICYLPLIFIWILWKNMTSIKNQILRILITPVLVILFGSIAYFSAEWISSEDEKYSLEMIAERAQITAYDIRYGWGARTGEGSGYTLGNLDGTWESMIRLFPQAINVSLFRPYLWEVSNPLMLLAALESLAVFLFSIWYLIIQRGIINVFQDPFLLFCFLFALLFAFAVGVSTFNFGTLMRYKIPLMFFYLIVLPISKTPKRLHGSTVNRT